MKQIFFAGIIGLCIALAGQQVYAWQADQIEAASVTPTPSCTPTPERADMMSGTPSPMVSPEAILPTASPSAAETITPIAGASATPVPSSNTVNVTPTPTVGIPGAPATGRADN